MFCENCGREVRREDLNRLLEPDGEPVVCPGCGKRLETAEFCGGFWGLIASASEEDKGAESHFSGVTEADRILARKILAGENDQHEEKEGDIREKRMKPENRKGRADSPAGEDAGSGERTGPDVRRTGPKTQDRIGKGASADGISHRERMEERTEKRTQKRTEKPAEKKKEMKLEKKRGGASLPVLLLLCAAALCVGFLIGKMFPAGGTGGRDGAVQDGTGVQTPSADQSEPVLPETQEQSQGQETAGAGGTTAAAAEQSTAISAEAETGSSSEHSTAISAEAETGSSSEQSTASSAEAETGWSSEQSEAASADAASEEALD